MAALDNGIISAALTTINSSFEVSANWGAWGVTLYTLGLAISVPIIGKLSDRYGRKKLFIIEIALFGLGSFLVALSPNFVFYLSARFLQALGGGGIFIIGSSHVLSTMPAEKQGRALGMLGGMNGIAAVLGPNIGSMLLDLTGSWHVLFLINVPIAILLIIFGWLKLEETKDPATGRLDLFGTILLSLSVLGIMYGLTNIEGVEFWDSVLNPNVYGFILTGLVLFIALIFHESKLEKRGGDPVLPYRLLKQPPYLLTLLIGAFSGALLAAMIFVPAFTEQVLGIAAENSGYWLTPLALMAGIGASLGGAFVDKRGPITAVLLSGVITAIGFVLFPTWVDTKWQFLISSSIAGLGMGIILGAPLNILATETLKSDKGSALSTLSLSRQIGMTLAPTIYAGFIARGFNQIPDLFKSEFPSILKEKMSEVNLSPEAMQEFSQLAGKFSSQSGDVSEDMMMEAFNQIKDPNLKEVIQSSVEQVTHMAAQDGFGGLFYSAVILAILAIIVTFILAPIRKKRLVKSNQGFTS
ncbi:MFS transporter [Fervidibacillus halotolerans]|uniref:MFS transporter n=1 Tax=Fervidibacillus halotolerans TaxID=2980027 RepID=A0A9E8M1R4_9BACI|nr:MFS transporter [Fervidibacillus halotolerans]WAA13870.1 MFS transporter [Fervidibacillus halotolerans]